MSCDADGAIRVLQEGLKLEKENTFKQADSLVISLPPNLNRDLSFSTVGVRTGMDVIKSAEVPGSSRHVHEDG